MESETTTNIELSKRVALLELENDRLRTNLENMRIDLNSRIAANEGLKSKITELYVELQSTLQNKRKCENLLNETNDKLTVADSTTQWYKSQLHNIQADRSSLRLEISMYQNMLKQRQQGIIDLTSKYRQLGHDYTETMKKHQKERQCSHDEIRKLKLQTNVQKNTMESCLIRCLKQALARNRNLNDRLKSLTKTIDESIDEGYGDDIPSPIPLNPLSLDSIFNLKNLFVPLHTELDLLRTKMNKLKIGCDSIIN